MIKRAEPPYVPQGKQMFDKFMQVLPMELMEQATGGKLPALAYPAWQQMAVKLDAKIEQMTAAMLDPDNDAETVDKAAMLQAGYIRMREALTQGKTMTQVDELATQMLREFAQKYPDHVIDSDVEGSS